MSELERIAVIGAGLMGHAIAQIFAAHGHPVSIVDNNEESLNTVRNRIRTNLTTMAEHGVKLSDEIDPIVERVQPTTNMKVACGDVAFVIEAVFEDMALKQQIFAELDGLCPPTTVLCSNTSVMSITEIASKSQHCERIIGTHFWNPPHLIPLVEVVRTEHAADRCIEATYDLLQRVGKHPVRVHRDVPGFVGNRLQHALWREAFAIIDEGICDPATVDEVVRSGFGLRLPILGPIVIIGGIGTVTGPIIGAIFITLLSENLADFYTYHLIITGVILILAIRFMPSGIWGTIRDSRLATHITKALRPDIPEQQVEGI